MIFKWEFNNALASVPIVVKYNVECSEFYVIAVKKPKLSVLIHNSTLFFVCPQLIILLRQIQIYIHITL